MRQASDGEVFTSPARLFTFVALCIDFVAHHRTLYKE